MGVVVTNGSGSPRDGIYADYTDEEMMRVRRVEQKKAACVGEYCAQVLLDYPSAAVKDPTATDVVDDLKTILAGGKAEGGLHPQPRGQARHARGRRAAR